MSHSRKILSQAGTSLADVYDIEGSIVGLEELDAADVKVVHDLGPQIHSERLLSFLIRVTPGGVAQNTAFNVTTGGIPDSVNRLLAITVIADGTAEITNAQASIQDPNSENEIPLWSWDSTNDVENTIQWSDGGAAVSARFLLVAKHDHPIELLTRIGDAGPMPQIIFRGLTSGFGAGLVIPILLLHLARPDRGNPSAGSPSSHGLPVPSW